MQAFTIAPPGHQTPGKFIHDDHFTVFNDVINIELKQSVRFEGLVYMVQQFNILGIKKVVDLEQIFSFGNAIFT